MTKWSLFWFYCVVGLYIASALYYKNCAYTDLYTHPLFIFSVLVLAGLIVCFRAYESFKSTLFFIMALILTIVCCINYLGA